MSVKKGDFVLMYVIGLLIYISFFAIAFIGFPISLLFFLIILLSLLPGLFYFSRNVCGAKEALAISALFGFSFWPVLTIFYLVYLAVSGILTPGYNSVGYAMLFPGVGYVIEVVVYSTIITTITMVSYAIRKYLIK